MPPALRRRRAAGTAGMSCASPVTDQASAATSWRPRADDTGWMDDFSSWRRDRRSRSPGPARSPARRALTVLPVALFLAAIALGCLAMVLQARPLLAASFAGVAVSSALFFFLPILEMARRRDR
ncbi:MAG: hypothetical protein WKF43_06810 [Acidimicrobiales bacterium]